MGKLPKQTISADATIASVIDHLPDAEEYVRRVLERMHVLRKDDDDIFVRIGIRNRKECPNYRFDNYIRDGNSQTSWLVEAINGRTHRRLSDETAENEHYWSNNFLEYEQVRSILGYLRNINPLPDFR